MGRMADGRAGVKPCQSEAALVQAVPLQWAQWLIVAESPGEWAVWETSHHRLPAPPPVCRVVPGPRRSGPSRSSSRRTRALAKKALAAAPAKGLNCSSRGWPATSGQPGGPHRQARQNPCERTSGHAPPAVRGEVSGETGCRWLVSLSSVYPGLRLASCQASSAVCGPRPLSGPRPETLLGEVHMPESRRPRGAPIGGVRPHRRGFRTTRPLPVGGAAEKELLVLATGEVDPQGLGARRDSYAARQQYLAARRDHA